MSNNGMNYPLYNNLPYSHMIQQQSLYGQPFPAQPPMPQYGAYQMYPPMQNQSQYNSYDHLIQSAAETLAAFTHPSELANSSNQPARLLQQTFNRRSVSKPSNTTNSTRMYYCETCRIACGGHTSYQAHLNGTKHKKKEINSQIQQNNQNTFRCELCDIICTSSDAYQAHLDGIKHDKAVKLHRKLGKTIPEPANESQPVVNNEENSMKLIGTEYIETSYDGTNTPKSYYCKICDCKFNDANGRDAHLKGKRHRLSYKKKVNPNFQVDNNKSSSPKQRLNEPIESIQDLQINHGYNNRIDADEDTKYLMTLHQQIIPSQSLLNIVEEFVSAVETGLKLCSDRLRPSPPSNIDDTLNQHPLMGVSRTGLLVKSLMIKSDRLFHLVVICTEWPTEKLYEKIYSILTETSSEIWNIQCDKTSEIIQVHINTTEGEISVSISFTSLSVQQDIQTTERVLTKINCSNALNAIHSVRWFQNQVSKRQHASALIRCLRYKTTISSNWRSLSSEAIEILIEHILSKSHTPIGAFRRILEYLSGGLVLPNGPGLRVPWKNDLIKDIFENLNDQERNNITQEAQLGLRLLAFGQINKWFEQCDIPQVQKRSYSIDDNQSLVSIKRQCIKSENIEEQYLLV